MYLLLFIIFIIVIVILFKLYSCDISGGSDEKIINDATKFGRYILPSSNSQIKNIAIHGNKSEYSRLINLLLKFLPKFKRSEICKLVYKSDDEIYNLICRSGGYTPSANNKGSKDFRSNYFTDGLIDIWYNNVKNTKINKYLDIGCGDGSITETFAEKLNVKDVNCVEVSNDLSNKSIKYSYVKNGQKLPYNSNEFDLVTAFMSLHHIKDIDNIISEIVRVLNNGGYLFIREHDSFNAIDSMLVDIEHAAYIKCDNKGYGDDSGYLFYHVNSAFWDDKFAELSKIGGGIFYVGSRAEISPTRAIWRIYQKLK